MNTVKESDWKKFRARLPQWQERYMDRLNHAYIALLEGEGAASEKFWELVKRVNKNRRDTGVIAEMSRSKMIYSLADLLNEGAITEDDIADFSEEVRQHVSMLRN